MCFKTMVAKLSAGVYASWEPFEADFALVCANAMAYNAPDTIYFKEAAKLQRFGNDRIGVSKSRFAGELALRDADSRVTGRQRPSVPAAWRVSPLHG